MAECIKTGARVLLQEYTVVVAADIHSVPGGIIVVKFNPESFKQPTASELIATTHEAVIGHGFFRKEEGILVIPDTYIIEVKRD